MKERLHAYFYRDPQSCARRRIAFFTPLLPALVLLATGVARILLAAFPPRFPLLWDAILQVVFLLLPAGVLFFLFLARRPADTYLHLPTAAHLPLLLWSGLALFLFTVTYDFLLTRWGLLPAATGGERAGITLPVLLVFAILPALCEEFLCRGVLLPAYRALGAFPALCCSALFFALLHFEPARLPLHLFCGLLLGGVSLFTQSFWAAVIVRILYELLALLCTGYFAFLREQLQEFPLFAFLSAVLALLCLFAAFTTAERLLRHRAVLRRPLPPEQTEAAHYPLLMRLGEVLISPLLWLCILLYTGFCLFL